MRIVAALALLAGAAHAQVVSRVDLRACGIYENVVQGREDDAAAASGQRTIIADHRLIDETSRIPARPGVSFGCQVTLQGAPAGEHATFLAVIRLPRGEVSGSQAYRIGEAGYVGYTLRGAQPGPRTLEIWIEGRKLAEKSFSVVAP